MTIAIALFDTGPPERNVRDRIANARELSLRDRDRLLYELVLGFRSGDRPYWAPLILELMASSLKIRVARYCPAAPSMTVNDVYQELVCALLEDALSIPLDGPAHLERRLLLRSADRVSRFLQREVRHQREFESLEAWADQHEPDDHEEWLR